MSFVENNACDRSPDILVVSEGRASSKPFLNKLEIQRSWLNKYDFVVDGEIVQVSKDGKY